MKLLLTGQGGFICGRLRERPLFEAAAGTGVRLIVQFSALGADAQARAHSR